MTEHAFEVSPFFIIGRVATMADAKALIDSFPAEWRQKGHFCVSDPPHRLTDFKFEVSWCCHAIKDSPLLHLPFKVETPDRRIWREP